MQRVESNQESDYELKLKNIIGRKAFKSRKNLLYDYEERIIYIAGCNLVIAKFDQNKIDQ
jgi:hypothetical protein